MENGRKVKHLIKGCNVKYTVCVERDLSSDSVRASWEEFSDAGSLEPTLY